MILPRIPPSVIRLRVTPDEPDSGPLTIPAGPRPKQSRRPHADASVAAVRRLIEHTTLTYGQIAAKTGVGRASICRWTRDHGWQRPPFAPRSTDTVPSLRAGARLKLRLLTGRLLAIAQRMVRELEDEPDTDIEKLVQAMQAVQMARLAAQGRRRRRRYGVVGEPRTGRQMASEAEAIRTALKEMRRGGVDLDRAPQEALNLVIEAHTPAEDHMMLKPPKGSGRRRF
jgi:hypothetical protein